MSPAIHHEMQCFLVTTRERCVVTTRGSCHCYLIRVKGGVHLRNQFAGSYEVEPTCWHLFVFIGTTVRSFDIRNNRIVALTPCGKDLIVSAFRKHSGQMKRVFSELSAEELHCLEVALKRLGKRAAALMEES